MMSDAPVTFRTLLDRTRAVIQEVDADQAQKMGDAGAAIIDVREQDEIEQGIVPGATHIPRGFLELRVEQSFPDRSQPVVVYCAGGTRSALAAKALNDMGYEQVVSLVGGFNAWKDAGLPWAAPRQLSAEQRRRYGRHLMLPEVAEAGQHKLLDAKILIVGAGGLGSPAALYLAAAGIGTLGIVDGDTVDESNLQRQILHTTDRIGTPKTESARLAMVALNPDVTVIEHRERLVPENIFHIVRDYDVVIDGTDNFASRYLINDACVLLKKPVVHGSIFRFDGQASVFGKGDGPCYRCLFPEPPPPELAPNCSEAGVLGVLPGVIGTIQAVEAIKLVLGIGETLSGRLLTYDALAQETWQVRLRRNPECSMCGPNGPTTLDGITYTDRSCAIAITAVD